MTVGHERGDSCHVVGPGEDVKEPVTTPPTPSHPSTAPASDTVPDTGKTEHAGPPPSPADSEQPSLWDLDPDQDTASAAEPVSAQQPTKAAEPATPAAGPATEGAPDDDIATHWSNLVAQAATHGFTVQTHYTGHTSLDVDTRAIRIAHNQQPLSRLVDLAQLVGAAAVHQAQVETATASTAPDPERTEAEPVQVEFVASETPIYDVLLQGGSAAGPTPTAHGGSIYDALLQEMGIADPLASLDPDSQTMNGRGHLLPLTGATRPNRHAQPLQQGIRARAV